MKTLSSSTPINKTTSLLFAENTIYNKTKFSKNKSYESNVRVKYEGGTAALYQIYYNPGTRTWGLWRCKYTNAAWEKPKFYATPEIAAKMAEQFYTEENLTEEECVVRKTSHITYSARGEIITETTYFTKCPE